MSEPKTSPWGSDADTVEYAAGQVPLPGLAIQLRRIANAMRQKTKPGRAALSVAEIWPRTCKGAKP